MQVQAKRMPSSLAQQMALAAAGSCRLQQGEQGMCNQTPFFVGFMDTGLTFRLSSIVWLQHSNSAAQGLQEFLLPAPFLLLQQHCVVFEAVYKRLSATIMVCLTGHQVG
jgi:hypothetical protein